MSGDKGWIGVDLDGTLAKWEPPYNIWEIGEPIEPMVRRVKQWLENGIEVRIVTARVASTGLTNDTGTRDDREFAARQKALIEQWCWDILGEKLRVTATKDFKMLELWDDRAIRVETNTGHVLSTRYRG